MDALVVKNNIKCTDYPSAHYLYLSSNVTPVKSYCLGISAQDILVLLKFISLMSVSNIELD